MKKISFAVAVIVLSGCSAAINIMPPEQSNVTKKIFVEQGYDKAWIGAVDWFAENHITIDKLDKESGIITAKHRLLVDNGELNCGEVVGTGTYQIMGQEKTVSLNVIVRKTDNEQATVQMNLSGEIFVSGRNWDTGANISASGRCVSTGKLEKSLESYY